MKYSMQSVVLCFVLSLVMGCVKKPISISNSTSEESIVLGKSFFSEKDGDTSDYKCEGEMIIKVKYMTEDFSEIAILSIPEQGKRIFVRTFSASGAEYVSGEYVWWLKGDVASLRQLGAKDITCKAMN